MNEADRDSSMPAYAQENRSKIERIVREFSKLVKIVEEQGLIEPGKLISMKKELTKLHHG